MSAFRNNIAQQGKRCAHTNLQSPMPRAQAWQRPCSGCPAGAGAVQASAWGASALLPQRLGQDGAEVPRSRSVLCPCLPQQQKHTAAAGRCFGCVDQAERIGTRSGQQLCPVQVVKAGDLGNSKWNATEEVVLEWSDRCTELNILCWPGLGKQPGRSVNLTIQSLPLEPCLPLLEARHTELRGTKETSLVAACASRYYLLLAQASSNSC